MKSGLCDEATTLTSIDGPYWVLVSRMRRYTDPYRNDVWGSGVLDKKKIRAAIAIGNFEENPVAVPFVRDPDDLEVDTRRVAFLVVNPDYTPIDVEVWDLEVSLDDGNHRFAAAIYRRDEYIAVNYGGDVGLFHRIFKKKFLLRDYPDGPPGFSKRI